MVNKSLLRHQRTVHGNEKRKCGICNVDLNGVNSLSRHFKQQKQCEMCGITSCGLKARRKHEREHEDNDDEWEQIDNNNKTMNGSRLITTTKINFGSEFHLILSDLVF